MLWLDPDVAAWLHRVAEANYDGDVQRAMNVKLRVAMLATEPPDDPWKAAMYEAATVRRR